MSTQSATECDISIATYILLRNLNCRLHQFLEGEDIQLTKTSGNRVGSFISEIITSSAKGVASRGMTSKCRAWVQCTDGNLTWTANSRSPQLLIFQSCWGWTLLSVRHLVRTQMTSSANFLTNLVSMFPSKYLTLYTGKLLLFFPNVLRKH
jgi:hypothetical protein